MPRQSAHYEQRWEWLKVCADLSTYEFPPHCSAAMSAREGRHGPAYRRRIVTTSEDAVKLTPRISFWEFGLTALLTAAATVSALVALDAYLKGSLLWLVTWR